MMFDGRPKPMPGRWSSHVASWHIVRISQFFGEHNRKKSFECLNYLKHVLFRLSRERDEAPIVAEALGPVGPCIKTSLSI
ncbi:hypothetical protein TNCV_1877241 [Trichonephila clavipes]|nr:hypothetical protein TNCV_1877241 [Trichonephila clavipes]